MRISKRGLNILFSLETFISYFCVRRDLRGISQFYDNCSEDKKRFPEEIAREAIPAALPAGKVSSDTNNKRNWETNFSRSCKAERASAKHRATGRANKRARVGEFSISSDIEGEGELRATKFASDLRIIARASNGISASSLARKWGGRGIRFRDIKILGIRSGPG